MRYCYIIANCRFSYFNIEKIDTDITEKIRFVLIVEKEYINYVPESFTKQLYRTFTIDHVNFTDCKEIIASLMEGRTNCENDCIVTCDEKSLMTAAILREHFNLKGPKPYRYVPFSSKRVMKQILSLSGVNITPFLDFDGIHNKNSLPEYHDYIYSLLGPYIIKPLDGGGSADTAKIYKKEDLIKWYNQSFSENDEYMVEKITEGIFYCCDSFVYNDELKFVKISEYLYPNLDFTFGMPIGTIPILKESDLYKKAFKLNQAIVAALKPPNGALHMEFFVRKQDNELIFIEIGARPAGKTICYLHEKNFNVNLYELTLRCELELPLNINIQENLYHSEVHLACFPGEVKKLNPPKLKSKATIDWHIKTGDKFDSFPSSLKGGVVADILLFNSNYTDLINDIDILRTHKAYL